MNKLHCIIAAAMVLALPASGADKPKRNKSPKGAKVYLVGVKDGKNVKKKFKVIFGLSGMGVSPAGITASGLPIPNTGHHHLLVNVDKLPPMDQPLPADKPDTIKHFGKGQTEVVLELKPGKHTLQLLFADYAHVPHDPPVMSKKITVTVK
ncbi:MAG: rod shape-determining protein RodA [Verrucomicrobiales bacterium]|nr:rod shape-determining protein RodA [Verrucomicrobiales bacterium]|tara:strand:+ start:974 stop:1426 length:453 start_codon:yes stop_codon:yes gene_type:complete